MKFGKAQNTEISHLNIQVEKQQVLTSNTGHEFWKKKMMKNMAALKK